MNASIALTVALAIHAADVEAPVRASAHPSSGEAPSRKQLADAMVRDIVAIAGCGEESVSVGIEEVSSSDWTAKVYRPDIETAAARGTLYRRPGYEP